MPERVWPNKKPEPKPWRPRRGSDAAGECVIIDEDSCPPSRFEVAMCARSKVLREMVMGPDRRRCLPEIAALVIMAVLKRGKNLGVLARHIGSTPHQLGLMRLGLIPMRPNGVRVCDRTIIRLAWQADLGMAEAMMIYGRCCVPRQYAPWRAYPAMGAAGEKKFWVTPPACDPDYLAVHTLFQAEMVGSGLPQGHWREFERLMEMELAKEGMTPQETGAVFRRMTDALTRYFPDGPNGPVVHRFYGGDPGDEDGTHGGPHEEWPGRKPRKIKLGRGGYL